MNKQLKDSTYDSLIIFYDGNCPLCSMEMQHLKLNDTNESIILINLHDNDFKISFPYVDKAQAMRILHGRYQGKNLFGLAVTHRAWSLVGKGFWVAPLNWPLVKQLAHLVYLVVAKYRQSISAFLAKHFNIKTMQCTSEVCYEQKAHTNNRGK